MLRRYLMTLAAALVLMTTTVVAQERTGTIQGKITDTAGVALEGASVVVMGTAFGAVTDHEGVYTIYNVPPGTYTLRVTALKHRTKVISSILVTAHRATTQDIRLAVDSRSAKDVVTVEGTRKQKAGSALSTDSATKQATRGDSESGATSAPSDYSPAPIDFGRIGAEILSNFDRKKKKTQPTGPKAAGESGRETKRIRPQWEDDIDDDDKDSFHRRPHADWYYGSFDAMYFRHYGFNPFVDPRYDNKSTFAVDVDDASFTLAKSYLERGVVPPADAIRTEEFINHFEFDYPQPDDNAFSVIVEGTPSLFNERRTYTLAIGLQGVEIDRREREPVNLVLVVDVSGSMRHGNRIGLVSRSIELLAQQLTRRDRLAIVAYNTYADVRLNPTNAKRGRAIQRAVNSLVPGGSTNAEAGLLLGFEVANDMARRGRNTKVILFSDGVANVGTTGPESLTAKIKSFAKRGVTLSTFGVGMGNYNDVLLERLANDGDGSYAYINNHQEARRQFIDKVVGTLQTIARDVKIQVEFDPRVVSRYRLLGYENRSVADHQFRNDRVDGGEIGAGHQVTALYEITVHQRAKGRDLGRVNIRYHEGNRIGHVHEISARIEWGDLRTAFRYGDDNLRLAVVAAELGELLRDSYWAKTYRPADLLPHLEPLRYGPLAEQADELYDMIIRADRLEGALAGR